MLVELLGAYLHGEDPISVLQGLALVFGCIASLVAVEGCVSARFQMLRNTLEGKGDRVRAAMNAAATGGALRTHVFHTIV